MKDALICIGAGKLQLPIIKAAKSLGHCVIGIDFDDKAPGFFYTDTSVIHSTHDPDAIIEALEVLNNQ